MKLPTSPVVPRDWLGRNCSVAGNGENGALAGIVHRFVESIRALPDGYGKIGSGGHTPITQCLGEPQEKVSQHHPGVAPGAEHSGLSHGFSGDRKRSVAERFESVGDGPKGQGEVGAGIADRVPGRH